MYGKNILKICIFILICIFLFSSISSFFTRSEDYRNYHLVSDFYDEPENSLDAVYIGASNAYAYWHSTLAWKHYGIAVYPLSSSGQPFGAIRHLIEDARKTQPNTLFIISINHFFDATTDLGIHYLIDSMPLSLNKIDLIQKLSSQNGYSMGERMEFFFPIIRYHERWSNLSEKKFCDTWGGMKGDIIYGGFYSVSDVSGEYRSTSRRLDFAESIQEEVESILDYCDEENINVLFVAVPQTISESKLAQFNMLMDLLDSREYPVFDMMEAIEEIGLDLTKDYYNTTHTNFHGGVKVTDYLAKYLVEHYGFGDKRGNETYRSWDEAYDKFIEDVAPYSLDFEYTNASRNFSLSAPKLSRLAVNGTKMTLTWESVSDADGYQVYRKTGDSGWMPVASVDASTLTYTDKDCAVAEKYTYTVASFQEKDGERYWGNYDFSGLSATALLGAPGALGLSGAENNLTLTWESVKGADGYQVFRRVFAKTWINIADTGSKTFYTDTAMLEDIPYQYRVRAYWYDEDGNIVYGSYSSDCLWLPELSSPEVIVDLDNGVPTLSWPVVEGVTGYTISQKTADDEWTQIADPLPADCTGFRDITAQAGSSYAYQVTAYFTYNGETYGYSTETTEIQAQSSAIQLDPPVILFGEQVGDNVRLIWEPQENATAYRIYRQKEDSDSWTVVSQSITGNTYQQKPPEDGVYSYMIQSLRTENGCTYYGKTRPNTAVSIAYDG